MKINYVKLKNIRSYKDEKIDFSEGITLLSGDIGSGKSSILLAMEFAFFGLQGKGLLSGNALMRKGSDEAEVEVCFEINENEVVIKRTLKRGSNGITQKDALLVINGSAMQLSANELKSKVLELFNYPNEILSKQKVPLFRYTVYTPQEEMKKILFEDIDSRLDALRKIFGIEKYKRVKENVDAYKLGLKRELNFLKGKVDTFEKREEELKNSDDEIKKLKIDLENLNKTILVFEKKYNEQKESKEKLENEFNSLKEKKMKQESLSNRIKNLKNDLKGISEKTESLQKENEDISSLENKKLDIQKNIQNIENIDDKISNLNKKISEIRIFIKTNENKKLDIQNELKNVESLDVCPKCHQKVDETHKEKIRGDANKEINVLNEKIDLKNEELKKLEPELNLFKEKKSKFENLKLNLQKINMQIENILKQKELLEQLKKEYEFKKKELEESFVEKDNLVKDLEKYDELEKEFNEKNKHLMDAFEQYNSTKIRNAELSAKLDEKISQFKKLNEFIEQMKKDKEKIKKVKLLIDWIKDKFMVLVDKMERAVMTKIYNEFNQFFIEWFNMLVDDQNIDVGIDIDFSPKVMQNGYDIDVSYLSGGEKTAIALAYRLALNKVVNDISGDIKTKDLLILDEPTDGFSSEQLDKLNDVLIKLDMAQIIIVSHEQKIEGFADEVIRITKRNHVSRKE